MSRVLRANSNNSSKVVLHDRSQRTAPLKMSEKRREIINRHRLPEIRRYNLRPHAPKMEGPAGNSPSSCFNAAATDDIGKGQIGTQNTPNPGWAH